MDKSASTGMEKTASSTKIRYECLNTRIEKWTTVLNVIMVRVTPAILIVTCISPVIWIHSTRGLQHEDYKLVYYFWLELN